MSLDTRLLSLYGALDTAPGFDAAVRARIQEESARIAVETAARARAAEMQRYRMERRRQSWGAWIRRSATLEALGGAAFAGCVAHAVWTGIQIPAVVLTPADAVLGATALGIALAVAAPALLLHRHRHMSRL